MGRVSKCGSGHGLLAYYGVGGVGESFYRYFPSDLGDGGDSGSADSVISGNGVGNDGGGGNNRGNGVI